MRGIADVAKSQYVRKSKRVQRELTRPSLNGSDYTEVLEFLHYSKAKGLSENTVARLKSELSYRQQYQWYIKSLLEDVSASCQKIARSSDSFRREMGDLKALVGSKTSVPKEQVYPKFDALSKWHELLKQERRQCVASDSR